MEINSGIAAWEISHGGKGKLWEASTPLISPKKTNVIEIKQHFPDFIMQLQPGELVGQHLTFSTK